MVVRIGDTVVVRMGEIVVVCEVVGNGDTVVVRIGEMVVVCEVVGNGDTVVVRMGEIVVVCEMVVVLRVVLVVVGGNPPPTSRIAALTGAYQQFANFRVPLSLKCTPSVKSVGCTNPVQQSTTVIGEAAVDFPGAQSAMAAFKATVCPGQLQAVHPPGSIGGI